MAPCNRSTKISGPLAPLYYTICRATKLYGLCVGNCACYFTATPGQAQNPLILLSPNDMAFPGSLNPSLHHIGYTIHTNWVTSRGATSKCTSIPQYSRPYKKKNKTKKKNKKTSKTENMTEFGFLGCAFITVLYCRLNPTVFCLAFIRFCYPPLLPPAPPTNTHSPLPNPPTFRALYLHR